MVRSCSLPDGSLTNVNFGSTPEIANILLLSCLSIVTKGTLRIVASSLCCGNVNMTIFSACDLFHFARLSNILYELYSYRRSDCAKKYGSITMISVQGDALFSISDQSLMSLNAYALVAGLPSISKFSKVFISFPSSLKSKQP